MIIDDLKRARAVGVPVVAIATPDQPALVATIQAGLNGSTPLIRWDLIGAFQALNEKGQDVAPQGEEFCNPVEALKAALHFEQGSALVMVNAHRFVDETPVMQCVMNLRDQYKATGRTLVLLGPDFRLPVELAQDTLILDEELPSPDAIRAIVSELLDGGGIETTPELLDAATGALRGLAAFPVEQATALSVNLRTKTVDLGELWQRKRRMVEQTEGLSMRPARHKFDESGGQAAWKEFARRRFTGPDKPRCIVNIEEIEKQMAGAGDDAYVGDGGSNKDMLQVLLTEMEDHGQDGALFVGVQGGGKSFEAEATAAEFEIPFLRLDLGATKGSLQGESQRKIRAAAKTILAIAGEGGAFYIGTCNSLNNLTPALQRRFTSGVWYFDLSDADERLTVGRIHIKANDLVDEPENWFVNKEGYSAADIRTVCRQARKLRCSLEEASRYVVPAAQMNPDAIARLRAMANNRFLSASKPGPYKAPSALIETAKPVIRKLGEVYAATMPETPSEEEKAGGN